MEQLFATLTDAVQGSLAVAGATAFVWGVLSLVLSPCHLASIPLVIAYISEQDAGTSRRALGLSAVFGAGILVTIGLVGAITASLGRMLGDVGPIVNYAVAAIFFLLGLHFLGVFPLPWSSAGPKTGSRRGALGAFLLGLIFGIGVGPCTFAFMAPMLGVTFTVATTSWARGVLLLLLYGVGHTAVIVAAGTSAQLAQRTVNWNADSRGAAILRQVCGVLVILGGLYLLWTAG